MDPRLQDPRVVTCAHGQVYSQNNEDGIISEIFRRIGTKNLTFVEFGVGDGQQKNTRLLLELGWSGRWVEGDTQSASAIRDHFREQLKTGQLELIETMVTRENARGLAHLDLHGDEPDLLSIDVDFLTSHVWRELSNIKPRLVCIEYNAHYPASVAHEVPYKQEQGWKGDTRFGASLKQLELIGTELGYALVGCDLMSVNAFFVRADLASTEHFLEPQRTITSRHAFLWFTIAGTRRLHRSLPSSRRIGTDAAAITCQSSLVCKSISTDLPPTD